MSAPTPFGVVETLQLVPGGKPADIVISGDGWSWVGGAGEDRGTGSYRKENGGVADRDAGEWSARDAGNAARHDPVGGAIRTLEDVKKPDVAGVARIPSTTRRPIVGSNCATVPTVCWPFMASDT